MDTYEGQVITIGNKRPEFSHLALITQVGLSMITPILIGVFLGQYLDKRLQTGGVFFIVLMLLGVASAFYNLMRIPRLYRQRGQDSESAKENDDERNLP